MAAHGAVQCALPCVPGGERVRSAHGPLRPQHPRSIGVLRGVPVPTCRKEDARAEPEATRLARREQPSFPASRLRPCRRHGPAKALERVRVHVRRGVCARAITCTDTDEPTPHGDRHGRTVRRRRLTTGHGPRSPRTPEAGHLWPRNRRCQLSGIAGRAARASETGGRVAPEAHARGVSWRHSVGTPCVSVSTLQGRHKAA